MMASLPIERTTLSRPFYNAGLDFAGTFDMESFTGRYCKIAKGYSFICFATIAIHLEVVSELTSQLVSPISFTTAKEVLKPFFEPSVQMKDHLVFL